MHNLTKTAFNKQKNIHFIFYRCTSLLLFSRQMALQSNCSLIPDVRTFFQTQTSLQSERVLTPKLHKYDLVNLVCTIQNKYFCKKFKATVKPPQKNHLFVLPKGLCSLKDNKLITDELKYKGEINVSEALFGGFLTLLHLQGNADPQRCCGAIEHKIEI